MQFIHIVDSEIIRAIIQKESYGFNTFIGTRIGKIHSHSHPCEWYWIKAEMKIADIITKDKDRIKIGKYSEWPGVYGITCGELANKSGWLLSGIA